MIAHGRRIVLDKRVHPDRAHAEIGKIVEVIDNPLEVASVPPVRVLGGRFLYHPRCGVVRCVPVGKPVRRNEVDDVGWIKSLVPSPGGLSFENRVTQRDAVGPVIQRKKVEALKGISRNVDIDEHI